MSKIKSKYLYTSWFERSRQEYRHTILRINSELKELPKQNVQNIAVQFNAYGVTDQVKYFSQHYDNVLHTIKALKQLRLSQFKFKFIGWQLITPQRFLQEIFHIQTNNIDINVSNTPGSEGIILQIIKIIQKQTCFYNSVRVILANWRMPFKCLKNFEKLSILNEPKTMTIELSGWGQDEGVHKDPVVQFFGLKSKDESEKAIREFHGWLREFFSQTLLASVQRELNFDMRNWNEKFGLKTLKKELDALIKDKCPQPSLISRSANLEAQKFQKINLEI